MPEVRAPMELYREWNLPVQLSHVQHIRKSEPDETRQDDPRPEAEALTSKRVVVRPSPGPTTKNLIETANRLTITGGNSYESISHQV